MRVALYLVLTAALTLSGLLMGVHVCVVLNRWAIRRHHNRRKGTVL